MGVNPLLKTLNTHPSRYFLRKLIGKKTKSGKNLLEEYLYCYFSGTVTEETKCFLNYKTNLFNFFMHVFEKTIIKPPNKISKYDSKSATKYSKAVSLFLKSIAKYGFKKPMVYTSPIYIIWYITNECNLKCLQCSEDSGPNKKDELTIEEKYNIVDQIADLGCIILHFAGGEPLISKDFYKIAEYASKRGLILKLSTNGTLITQSVAKRLKNIGIDSVLISLDGAKKGTHDKIRGIPGSYERVIQGIKNCVKEEIPVHMSMTLTQYNYQEIDEVIELSKNLGINFGLVDFYPVGRGSKNVDFLIISPEMRYKIFKEIAEKSLQDKNIESLIFSPLFLPFMNELKPVAVDAFSNNVSIDFTQFRNLYFSGCCAGRMYFRIDSNGDIKPCGYIDIVVGNTKRDKIIDVWNNSEVFKTLRSRENLKGNCGSCKDKYVCGGCRASAYNYFKDLTAPDPGCIKNIKYWEEIKNKV